MPTHVESVVEKVRVRQVFFEYVDLFCIIPLMFHTHNHASTIVCITLPHTAHHPKVRTYPSHYMASHKTVIFTVASGKNLKSRHVLVVVVNDAARIGDCKAQICRVTD